MVKNIQLASLDAWNFVENIQSAVMRSPGNICLHCYQAWAWPWHIHGSALPPWWAQWAVVCSLLHTGQWSGKLSAGIHSAPACSAQSALLGIPGLSIDGSLSHQWHVDNSVFLSVAFWTQSFDLGFAYSTGMGRSVFDFERHLGKKTLKLFSSCSDHSLLDTQWVPCTSQPRPCRVLEIWFPKPHPLALMHLMLLVRALMCHLVQRVADLHNIFFLWSMSSTISKSIIIS